jgi:hypothetical protein
VVTAGAGAGDDSGICASPGEAASITKMADNESRRLRNGHLPRGGEVNRGSDRHCGGLKPHGKGGAKAAAPPPRAAKPASDGLSASVTLQRLALWSPIRSSLAAAGRFLPTFRPLRCNARGPAPPEQAAAPAAVCEQQEPRAQKPTAFGVLEDAASLSNAERLTRGSGRVCVRIPRDDLSDAADVLAPFTAAAPSSRSGFERSAPRPEPSRLHEPTSLLGERSRAQSGISAP